MKLSVFLMVALAGAVRVPAGRGGIVMQQPGFFSSQRELDECIVDAENPDELASCLESQAAPKASSPKNFFRKVLSLFSADKAASNANAVPVPAPDFDLDECIVQAENADEISACQN